MAKFISVNKTVQKELFDIVKFQLIYYCFENKVSLSETEMNCLSLLGCKGEIRLIEFCRLAVDVGLLGTPTAVNNCLCRIEHSKLYIKKGAGKKIIFLNPDLGVQTKGNILLNYKIFRVESDQLQGVDKIDSATTQSV